MNNVTTLTPPLADETEVSDAVEKAIDSAIANLGKPVSGLAVVGALRLYEHRLLAMTL